MAYFIIGIFPCHSKHILQRFLDNLIKTYEDRELQKHRKAAAQHTYVILFINLHHFLLKFLLVIFVLFLKFGDIRLNFLLLSHRLLRAEVKRHQNQLDYDGKQNYGKTVILNKIKNKFNDKAHRSGNKKLKHRLFFLSVISFLLWRYGVVASLVEWMTL